MCVRWFEVDKLPSLAFDHAAIIALARGRLCFRLDGVRGRVWLSPQKFTLNELWTLYEIVGGERIDPRKFRRRVLALELVEETGKIQVGTRRAARLYRVSRRKSL